MISLYRYHLPFNKPFLTGKKSFTHREGVLIRFLSNASDLWAEASPLPGFSDESFAEVSSILTDRLADLNTFLTSDFELHELRKWLSSWPAAPSLQYALSYLGLRILALRNKCCPSSFFPFDLSPTLYINDIVGMSEPDEVRHRVHLSGKLGFTTIKFKAGTNLRELAEILKDVSADNPGLRFRIDANQGWPTDKLSQFGTLFSELPVEYVEEPCRYRSTTDLRERVSSLRLPVALDESIRSFEQLKTTKTSIPSLFIVIKPALYGSIFEMMETIFTIRSKRTKMVFSTLLESKIGRDMTLFCAAMMGDPNLAHGLNTGFLFKEDLQPDFDIRNGQIGTGSLFRSRGKPIRYNFLNALNGIHS